MRLLLWAELRKLRRSNIILVAFFATIFVAVIVFIGGFTAAYSEEFTVNDSGWYMTITQTWATLFVLPAMIALLGSYMICREEQDDTMKILRIIPVSEMKLTIAKMIVAFVLSIFLYLFLFFITLLVEASMHFLDLSWSMVLHLMKMYFFDGIGVFFAIAPIIAAISYWKKSYWLALVLAELYSFGGLFMSVSKTLRTFYPITAVFGVSGYYETSGLERLESSAVLLFCGVISFVILSGLNYKGGNHEKKII